MIILITEYRCADYNEFGKNDDVSVLEWENKTLKNDEYSFSFSDYFKSSSLLKGQVSSCIHQNHLGDIQYWVELRLLDLI